jgi:hypothetical protein
MHKKSLFINLSFITGFLLVIFLFFSYWYMVKCEGSWNGVPLERQGDSDLGNIRKELESDIYHMAVRLGPRNAFSYERLQKCAEWIKKRWESQGYAVKSHKFSIQEKDYENLEIEIRGQKTPTEIVVVSAQYDTLPDSPGANNNASGVAVLLQLSNLLKNFSPDRTLRLVNFVNEEDPFFGTEWMGSFKYAENAYQKHENIKIMLSIDSIGIYKDEPGSQKLPFPFSVFYPDRGNFLAFIGDFGSRKYMIQATRGFKKGSSFLIKAGVVPKWAKGAAWSDHSSFWKFGYPGIQITDTGAFRSPYHTTKEDTIEKINLDALSRIVMGMYGSIIELSKSKQ